MTFKRPNGAGLAVLAIAALCLIGLTGVAFAEDAAPAAAAAPVPNKGDVAWMLTSSALVLMMSIPGLALFYGGLVRTKNMASVLTQNAPHWCVRHSSFMEPAQRPVRLSSDKSRCSA